MYSQLKAQYRASLSQWSFDKTWKKSLAFLMVSCRYQCAGGKGHEASKHDVVLACLHKILPHTATCSVCYLGIAEELRFSMIGHHNFKPFSTMSV
jgi:hypothetical protein